MRADGYLAGGFPNLDAECRFQPLAVGINKADYGNRGVADLCRELRDFVVCAFRSGVQDGTPLPFASTKEGFGPTLLEPHPSKGFTDHAGTRRPYHRSTFVLGGL